MTDLARLTVQLSADSARLQRDLDKAQSQVKRYQQKSSAEFNDAAKKIGKGIGIAVAAAATGLLALVKNSIDAADELNKLSQKVGIATDELSKLQYAAKLADVDTAALQTSLVKLSKNAVDAANGTGDAAAAFKALGVSVKDANGRVKSSQELFLEVADAFSRYEDGAEKTTAALAIFGKAGADLIPLLNGGRQAIKEAGDELERFGGVITPEAARRAEEFNDNLTRMETIAKGAGAEIAASLLPALVDVSKALVDLRENNFFKSDQIEKFAQDAAIALATVAESVYFLVKAINVLAHGLHLLSLDAQIVFASGGILTDKKQLEEFKKLLEERNQAVKEDNANYIDLWNYNGTALSDALRKQFDSQKKYVDKTKALIDEAIGLQGIDLTRPGLKPDDTPLIYRPGMAGSGKGKLNLPSEEAAKAAAAAAKKAAEERKKIAEAAAQAETTIFNAGLDRRQSALESSIELQKVTQEQYFRDLLAIQQEGIDQEIRQRRKQLETADPAERIKLLAEIEALQTKRLQISEETDAKIQASNKKLTNGLIAEIEAYKNQLDTLGKSYQRAVDAFGKGPAQKRYDEGRNQIDDDFQSQRMALEQQRRAQEITEQQYEQSLQSLENFHGQAIAQWNDYYTQIEERSKSFSLGFREAFEEYADAVKNVGQSLGNDLTGALDSAIDQTAELAANTILWGEGGAEAVRALARSILTDVVSSLIKAGLQMAINFALQETLGTAAAGAAAAQGAAVAASWTPAAIAASTATFGGAASAGLSAYLSSLAIGEAVTLAAVGGGFAEGGYTGNVGRGEVAGVVHGQEYVLNAEAVRRIGVSNLDMMNEGRMTVGAGANKAMGTSVPFQIINNAPGITFTPKANGLQVDALPEMYEMFETQLAARITTGRGQAASAISNKFGIGMKAVR